MGLDLGKALSPVMVIVLVLCSPDINVDCNPIPSQENVDKFENVKNDWEEQEIEEYERLLNEAKHQGRNQNPGFELLDENQHKFNPGAVSFESVHHGSHKHPHKDKLKEVQFKATMPPSLAAIEQSYSNKHREGNHHNKNNKHHHFDDLDTVQSVKTKQHKHHNKQHEEVHDNQQPAASPHLDEIAEKENGIKIPISANGEAVNVYSIPSTKEKDVKDEEVPDRAPVQALPIQQKPGQDDRHSKIRDAASMADVYFLAVVAGCSIAGLVGLVVAGVCWYRLQKNVKAAAEAEYPAYGVTGPSRDKVSSPGDRKLAQSAQMYHYQHQKQQMLALERANGDLGGQGSDVDSEEENEEGDYTVYECPGLAPTGEMEVKNPLFIDDTPGDTNGDNDDPPRD